MTDETSLRTPQQIADAVECAIGLNVDCGGTEGVHRVRDAVLAAIQPALARLAEYENTINWLTTCTSCARVLDSSIRETERAERAEAAIARVRAVPRLPHTSQQTGDLGRAYTRGWESVISAIDAALDEPGPAATEAAEPTHCPCDGTHFPSPENCRWCKCHRAWTPPPPGDTREQLPDHLLDLIRPYLRGYTSTACQTAGYLAEAIADQAEHQAELVVWRARMKARCRDNQKYTGEICPHHAAPGPA